MKFVWDEDKNIKNIVKHGVTFEEAKTVFFDEYMIRWDDFNHTNRDGTEERFYAIGRSSYNHILIVDFCEKIGDTIRIITAWKANKKQREAYNANH